MSSNWNYKIMILIGIVIIIIIMIIYKLFTNNKINSQYNFEKDLLNRLTNDLQFREEFLKNPKDKLQLLLSQKYGNIVLPPQLKVQLIMEDPNILYVLVPPYRSSNNSSNNPSNNSSNFSALEYILNILNENKTYGMFMGYYNNIFWRYGIHNGSCIKDIQNEVDNVYAGRQFQDC